MNSIAIAVGIFVLTYVAIATEKVHKAVAAILGAALIIILKVLDQETAFRAVDLNVILLLASMMVIVNIIKKTGIFQWLAIKAAEHDFESKKDDAASAGSGSLKLNFPDTGATRTD